MAAAVRNCTDSSAANEACHMLHICEALTLAARHSVDTRQGTQCKPGSKALKARPALLQHLSSKARQQSPQPQIRSSGTNGLTPSSCDALVMPPSLPLSPAPLQLSCIWQQQ